MPPKAERALRDIEHAGGQIIAALTAKRREQFVADPILSAAVERFFEIIGEAMNRMFKVDPDSARRISAYQQIISFRNVLIHGYDVVDAAEVWNVVQNDLPVLLTEVRQLLAADQPQSGS
jgi:uncharacterized protein with HEPN domain